MQIEREWEEVEMNKEKMEEKRKKKRSESRTFLNDSLTNLERNEGGKQVKKEEEEEELWREVNEIIQFKHSEFN